MINPLDLIFPPKCVCCDELISLKEKTPLCDICKAKWEQEKSICRERAGGLSVKRLDTSVFADEACGYVMYLVSYKPDKSYDVANSLILHLKDYADKKTVAFIADEIAHMIREGVPFIANGEERISDAVIAWIPRSKASVRECGFDHMKRVAEALSKRLFIKAEPILLRKGTALEQKYLAARDRAENARASMLVNPNADLRGKTVLLIDDIVTTGASLGVGASLILKAGAGQVICAVLAATQNDDTPQRSIRDAFNIIKIGKSKAR